jgi:hypothetical protein
VLGYIVEGTAICQIEGEAAQVLPVGSAFYEPAETVITNFGNASEVESMQFVAFYLLDGQQDLIRMLEAKSELGSLHLANDLPDDPQVRQDREKRMIELRSDPKR